MSEFIDILGASGASYRFRRIESPAQLPATAGNFIYSRRGPEGVVVICCGVVSSLLAAADTWRAAVAEHQADAIYIRLNVSRSVRIAEHDDIVAAHEPELVIVDRE